jgi:signal transduction histidine kinase
LDGIVERANPAFDRIFGEAAGAVVGQPLAKLLSLEPGGVRGWSSISDQARREGWSGEVEVNRDRAAQTIPADCTLSLVRTDRQAPLAFAVVLRDLRERKAFEARILRQQHELERAYADLKTVDRLKDHFLTRVSHELRTPLTSVLGTLEMMTIPGMVDADQQPAFIDIMFREAKVLAARVDKLLAIAKIESGQMPFSFEFADPTLVVESALTQVRPMAQQKGLAVEFAPQGECRRVQADPVQLGVALFEILENAVKFTDSGGVTVRLRQSLDETLIEIEDSGRGLNGVSPDVLFDTLGQVREEPESTHGLGLGLPLSRLIVNAHSGTLGVDGAPGGGSLFWIRLPMSAAPGETRPGEEVHS